MVGPPHSAHQLIARDPRVDSISEGSERKSVTETDLITAGGSNENVELPQTPTVNTDTSSPAEDAPTGTSTAETAPTADVASGDRPASLSTMVLPELRALAKQVGVEGASGMRKSELVAAIKERRGQSNGKPRAEAADSGTTAAADTATETGTEDQGSNDQQTQQRRERRSASRNTGAPSGSEQTKEQNKQDSGRQSKADTDGAQAKSEKSDTKPDTSDQQGDQGGQNRGSNADDDGEGRGGRRGRRFRDRRRRERGGEGGGGGDRDTELREDDVVQPVAGILDVLDNYAFVRTSGYLAGPNAVYVSMNMVRKNGL